MTTHLIFKHIVLVLVLVLELESLLVNLIDQTMISMIVKEEGEGMIDMMIEIEMIIDEENRPIVIVEKSMSMDTNKKMIIHHPVPTLPIGTMAQTLQVLAS